MDIFLGIIFGGVVAAIINYFTGRSKNKNDLLISDRENETNLKIANISNHIEIVAEEIEKVRKDFNGLTEKLITAEKGVSKQEGIDEQKEINAQKEFKKHNKEN